MISATKDNFDQEVLQSNVPVICDFYATWCGPCRALTPILESISNEANGQYKVVKIDTDDNPEIAEKYQISAIPTVLIFKNGEVAKRLVGLQTKAQLTEAVA